MRHSHIFNHGLFLVLTLANFFCNSRPNYDIFVYDFTSNCDGQVHLRIEHDPEPEVRGIKIEPEFKANADSSGVTFEDIGVKMHVRFRNGVECTFDPSSEVSSDCQFAESADPANCVSTRKAYSYRYPSRGPGFGGSIAKNESDEVIAADLKAEMELSTTRRLAEEAQAQAKK